MQVNSAAVTHVSIPMQAIQNSGHLSNVALRNADEHMETVSIPLQEYSDIPDEDGDTKTTMQNYDYGLDENNESCLAKWQKRHPVLARIAIGTAIASGIGLLAYAMRILASEDKIPNTVCDVKCDTNTGVVSFDCPDAYSSSSEYWAQIEWKNAKGRTCTDWEPVLGKGERKMLEGKNIRSNKTTKCSNIIEVKSIDREHRPTFPTVGKQRISCGFDDRYT